MKWRTKGYPDDTDENWSAPGIEYDTDDVKRWCPVKEIMALLSENIEDGEG